MRDCPSAERLAANELTPEERGAWLDHAATCAACRAIAVVMPTGAPETERIGRFEIVEEVGRGAMGVVYVAHDPALGRRVAIKVLHDATAVERLRREARALARLDHANVVRVYDVGFEDDRAFVAMELIRGQNMRKWLAAAPRTCREIVDVLVQAGRGLAAAHAAGIVHRDFKPDNVLVAPDRVVVGDFGLSQLGAEAAAPLDGALDIRSDDALDVRSDDALTASHAVVGTPAYMAPEQALGDATAASDQFAFCVAAWEALLGTRPFAGATLRELRAQAAAGLVLRPLHAKLPRRVEKVLRRGLAAQAEDRFPSMTALLAALAPSRRRRQAALAGLAIAALATAGWWWSRPVPDPCARVGAAVFDGWDAAAKARVRAMLGEATVAELDAAALAWRDARTALCRLPATTDLAELERRAAREACYERARLELVRTMRYSDGTHHTRARTIPLAACETGVVLAEAPGTESDPRGCGCPYSPCVEGRCTGECSARAFRLVGPIEGVAVAGRQEAVTGATPDGAVLLYLAGKRCALDHLFLARRVGDRYESTDLTPQLADRGVAIREGCCTLASDGRSIVVERRDAPGFLRFPIEGTQVGEPDPRAFAAVTVVDPPAGTRLYMPMLARDGRTFYFLRSDARMTHGLQAATRPHPLAPFGEPAKVLGRAGDYEYATGISGDELTLFMASEFATRVVIREHADELFSDMAPTIRPARLPGWRTIPIDGCRRLIATITPGGCESEQSVLFEAVGP